MVMLDKAFAEHFAAEWISAWNSHDLQRILSHYTEDFTMSSPRIAAIAMEPTGTLQGKKTVGVYWNKALSIAPDLHFELVSTLLGVDSVTIYYKGVRGMAAEVFFFDGDRKVTKAYAHYQ
jgi:SnoaL-like domain